MRGNAPIRSAQAIAARAFGAFSQIKDALVFAFAPPAIQELGRSAGFTFYLEDKAGLGHDALMAASGQLLMDAAKSPSAGQCPAQRPGRCATISAGRRFRKGQRAGTVGGSDQFDPAGRLGRPVYR